jgi:N-acetylglucosamine malate deacetylase 2
MNLVLSGFTRKNRNILHTVQSHKFIKMKILYVFPHPDDESFGPAPAISAQLRAGHEVYLLTLTRGEATKQRIRLGVDKKKMGEIRFNEMKCVEKVLGLTGMKVLDYPDNQLKELDPNKLENSVKEYINEVEPDILVTYAVHGISGFPDHLVTHAVVKSLFCKRRKSGNDNLRRLALFTRQGEVITNGNFRLNVSSDDAIDCIVTCNEEDMNKFHRSLDCYETYKEVIEESNVRNIVDEHVPFEFFQENFDEPVDDIVYGL